MLKENRTLGGELRNQLVATVTEMLEKTTALWYWMQIWVALLFSCALRNPIPTAL